MKGFTLIEILVVVGLFSAIATLSLGSLFNAQTINGRLQDTQVILDNVNLSVQTIVRDIRFATEFYATTTVLTAVPGIDGGPTTYRMTIPATLPSTRRNCVYGDGTSGKCNVLSFRSIDADHPDDRVVLYVESGVLYKKEILHTGASTTYQMTANDIEIKSLTFFVKGAQTSDGSSDEGGAFDYEQPLVTLMISGITKPSKSTVPPATFNIQTNISAREPDNQ